MPLRTKMLGYLYASPGIMTQHSTKLQLPHLERQLDLAAVPRLMIVVKSPL